MKYLLTFAASFALGVATLQLVPSYYSLPPISAVPVPPTLGTGNVTLSFQGSSSCRAPRYPAKHPPIVDGKYQTTGR